MALSTDAGRRVEIERRNVPGPAHDRDGVVPVLQRPSDRPSHVRLAPFLARRRDRPVPCCRHRFGDGIEGRRAVAPMLDDVLPPTLGIGVARSGGQLAERVGRRRVGDEFVVRLARRT